jgi:hypothetical protein
MEGSNYRLNVMRSLIFLIVSLGSRVAGITLLICVMLSSTVWSCNVNCQEERRFTGEQYWFWEGYLGIGDVVDVEKERRGHLLSDRNICFTVQLDELQDSVVRVRGYKRAIEEWLKVLYGNKDKKWDSDTQQLAARNKIRSLTGQDFPSLAALRKWWADNSDYLVWSEDKKQLVVDDASKRTNSPIAPLNPIQNITAERYWFYDGMGWLKDLINENEYVRAKAWSGDEETQVRILKSDLADKRSKEAGYRQAVQHIILERLAVPELRNADLSDLIQRLRDITTETFGDRESWINWWQTNKNKLILSEDGKRLIVKPR